MAQAVNKGFKLDIDVVSSLTAISKGHALPQGDDEMTVLEALESGFREQLQSIDQAAQAVPDISRALDRKTGSKSQREDLRKLMKRCVQMQRQSYSDALTKLLKLQGMIPRTKQAN
eukprot:gnl/MRDRNA2_/MRDRNA2_235177_c0_seq1.p1 gnl/MRDRNA2_/MRDRNA2_235177_c0~~gnl/MRDRNA2_/MRDRNA2_235177_c0_seq1.p1  ORF type:complete len:129 (-),score=16.96 gnl/MRDRNA2_/MRDRNA2_235177_c0_seq1:76-423(-)